MKKPILLFFIFTTLFAINLPPYFSATFTQKIYSDNKTLTYKGEVYTNSKDIFWKYTYPEEKYIWIKDKVYVYEPNLIQLTITKKPKINLFNVIKKATQIDKNKYIAQIDNKKIYFIFDKTLKKAWYKDDLGNKVVFTFKNQSNKKIDNTIFIPTSSKEVEIIYN